VINQSDIHCETNSALTFLKKLDLCGCPVYDITLTMAH